MRTQNHLSRAVITGITALAGAAAHAWAQSPSFIAEVGSFQNVERFGEYAIDTTGLADDYVAFRVTMDWSSARSPANSNSTQLVFGNPADFSPLIDDFLQPINGFNDGRSVAGLTWAGEFAINPASIQPAVTLAFQNNAFRAIANFDNIRVEWFTPNDIPTVRINPGATASNAPTDVIDLGVIGAAGDTPVFDTFGSSINTELALYAADGRLLFENDNAGGTLRSEIDTSAIRFDSTGAPSFAGLGEGDYFVILTEANATFRDGFDFAGGAEPGNNGSVDLNLDGSSVFSDDLFGEADPVVFRFTIVPTPGAAALFALASLSAARRRRAR